MSLLLDALKKAEQDKQKAREAEDAIEGEASPMEKDVASDNSSEQQHSDQIELDDNDDSQDKKIDDELELLIDEPETEPVVEKEKSEEQGSAPNASKPASSKPLELEKITATTSTVSDEALQLLVYKTNKKHRKNQKLIWGGLLSTAVLVLIMAGAYYYFGMVEEVNALERKHKLAMRSVRVELTKPDLEAVSIESPKTVKAVQTSQPKVKNKQVAATKPAVKVGKKLVTAPRLKRDFSIKKTKTEDPINTLLRDAWLAYNKADYSTASKIYENVLRREAKNRDALLGMAAVAIKSSDYKKAKASYRLLLKLDPRDQVAVSAMSNLEALSAGSQDESKLKFMLQQQPSASHLNFALGNYYARKNRWPEAQAEYFKAWQGNSDNADYIYNLAVSLDQLGKTKEALRFYRESLLYAMKQNISFSKADVDKRIEQISVK